MEKQEKQTIYQVPGIDFDHTMKQISAEGAGGSHGGVRLLFAGTISVMIGQRSDVTNV